MNSPIYARSFLPFQLRQGFCRHGTRYIRGRSIYIHFFASKESGSGNIRLRSLLTPNLLSFRDYHTGVTKIKNDLTLVEEEKDFDTLYNLLKYGLGAVALIIGIFYAYHSAYHKYAHPNAGAQVSIKTYGKPQLGGPFVLVDTQGQLRSQESFLGSWTFFYFGFVNCPEICPIELNRMSKVVDGIRKRVPGIKIVPLFISCDPQRDSLKHISEYIADFHPDFMGLVGTPEQIDHVCRSYRIYYSVPDAKAQEGNDYLIDHSIATFLFDPQGRFVDFFGSRYTEEEILEKMEGYIRNYEKNPSWTTW